MDQLRASVVDALTRIRGLAGTGVLLPPETIHDMCAQMLDDWRPEGGVSGDLVDRVRAAYSLSDHDVHALGLAMLPEIDGRGATIVAAANGDLQATFPTLGLIARSYDVVGPVACHYMASFAGRPAQRDGLFELQEPSLPLAQQTVRIAPPLVRELLGAGGAMGVDVFPPEIAMWEHALVTERTREELVTWLSDRRRAAPVLLIGERGSGRTTVARGVCARLGNALIALSLPSGRAKDPLRPARRAARWFDAAISVSVPDDVTDAELDELSGLAASWSSPVFVEMSAAVHRRWLTRGPAAFAVELQTIDAALSARVWTAVLGPRSSRDCDVTALADQFRFRVGHAARTVALARARSEIDADTTLHRELRRAAREIGSTTMSSLAEKMPQPYSRADLVVPAAVDDELDLAVAAIRHRMTVLGQWDLQRRIASGTGYTAMFCGESGTGKTMAAQVLARELALDLYRIDLSRVVSKYIGETEKNISVLFDEAAQSGAILFFDEADALFGRRSQVRDAHDRYANIEIGYLLQRMEEHDGVTILATNRDGDLDPAFMRRFHAVVRFPTPRAPERLRIWQGMFPNSLPRATDLDLPGLARHFELTGGLIRNIVMAAAYLAASDGAAVGMPHLKRALRRELLKMGRIADADVFEKVRG